MLRKSAKVRVNQPIFDRLCKWGTFFYLVLICFVPVKGFAADSSDRITVTATVPLQPAFARLIEKNSRVIVEPAILFPGEVAEISVTLVASGREVLRQHVLRMSIESGQGRDIKHFILVTNESGRGYISIKTDDAWIGTNRIRVEDQTYTEKSLVLEEKVFFSVVEPPKEEGSDKREQLKQSGAVESMTVASDSGEERQGGGTGPRSTLSESHEEKLFIEMRAGP